VRAVVAVAAIACAPLALAQEHDAMRGMNVGRAGSAQAATRTIAVVMSDDMRFTPSTIVVDAGQTVRFAVRNAGKVRHEFVIGSADDIAKHAATMREHPMAHHAEANAVSLAAGKTGSMTWRFGQAGTVTFACLEAGHFEAGMKGTIEVRPAAR
jgi:uncharacterized cupredoxin-like copper-binding protein